NGFERVDCLWCCAEFGALADDTFTIEFSFVELVIYVVVDNEITAVVASDRMNFFIRAQVSSVEGNILFDGCNRSTCIYRARIGYEACIAIPCQRYGTRSIGWKSGGIVIIVCTLNSIARTVFQSVHT